MYVLCEAKLSLRQKYRLWIQILKVLEIWQITIEEDLTDNSLKIQDVYEKQCIMLKSIIALSRTLPAYNVARDQHEENFHIKYNIYKQQPDLSLLGESRGSLLMGRIMTPHGELVVQVIGFIFKLNKFYNDFYYIIT